MNENLDQKYYTYAYDVLEGRVLACKYIKQACQRYLSFFDKYEFHPEKVDAVINFISKLKHSTGKVAGKPFLLEDWQKFCVYNIFGFYQKVETPNPANPNEPIVTEKRVTRNVYITVARKNGKSAFIAALCLYLMIADGEMGAEVDCIANSAKQARILYEMCRNFGSSIDPKGKYFQRFRDQIKFDKTKSYIQVLASDSSTLDGYNSYAFVEDEIHEAPDSSLYDVMKSSQGNRENPLSILITTRGFNLFSWCHEIEDTYIEILAGLKQDDSQFSMIYTLDEGDDWKDPKNWIKPNPNLGVTVYPDYLEEMVTRATNQPSQEVPVMTKNLNIWCSSSDVWIKNDLLLESSADFDFDIFNEKLVYCGVDLSSVSDMTAFCAMSVIDGKYYFKTKYYLPDSCLYDNPNSTQYRKWKREGYLNITPGNVVDYDYLKEDILRIQQQGALIDKIGYDEYNATSWAISCTEAGLPLEPYNQNLLNFNRPTKEFERLIKQGRVVLDNNPITRWCFNNAVLKHDHNENTKPIKGGDQMQKIDGCIAILESLGMYLQVPHYDNEIVTI